MTSNSTLEIKGKEGLLSTLGKLSTGSTVYYTTTRQASCHCHLGDALSSRFY